ncbi:Sec20-domain-containing protein [Russula dissimulans]|nr:Sec20-domain-containing protein [Russula dissimulans]
MSPLFDNATNASIAAIQRRQNDLREFQIPRLRGCSESLAVQQQYAAELREDLEAITHLVEALDENVDVQRNPRGRQDLRGVVDGFRVDITRLRKDVRAALLASKRAIDSKISSNREELLRASVLTQANTSDGKATEDAVMKAQVDVTETLRRTMGLMQSELERSVLSVQMLESSTASLKGTSATHDVLTGLLGTSKQLVTALEKADWLDRILIFASLAFFALVFVFILKQRFIDRGLRIAFWWTRLLPSVGRGDSLLGAKEIVLEKGTVTSQSMATVASSITASAAATVASQITHAALAEPDLASSSLFTTISTLQQSETPPPEPESLQLHDEL